MKRLAWLIYIPLQLIWLPLTLLGAVWVAYKQVGVSRKLGLSQTAVEVLNGRWTGDLLGWLRSYVAVAHENRRLHKVIDALQAEAEKLNMGEEYSHGLTGRSREQQKAGVGFMLDDWYSNATRDALRAQASAVSVAFVACIQLLKRHWAVTASVMFWIKGACQGCMMEQATLNGIQTQLVEALGEFVRLLPAGMLGRG